MKTALYQRKENKKEKKYKKVKKKKKKSIHDFLGFVTEPLLVVRARLAGDDLDRCSIICYNIQPP